jgi:cobalt/nickel transport system permease protein
MLFSPVQMHIPDGFLSTLVALVFWAITLPVIGAALKKTNRTLGEREVPLMGVLAAAIFAGQMLNFTVVGGTSGHLLGAAIATILLGPWPAILVMTVVVSTQALLFQDGGLIVLGANLFNMAIVGVAVSYLVYRIVLKLSVGNRWGVLGGGFAAAWSSIFIASLSCALQLAVSGTSPANIAVPAMAGIHALIGIGEGLITVGALAFVYAAKRELLTQPFAKDTRGILAGGGVLALALAGLSPLASSHPDGLEWVAEQNGFLALAREPFYNIIPDYVLPGLANEAIATIAAGVIGAIVVFIVALGVARNQKKTKSTG